MRITKAVIPAAGLGTRFLPATKVQPKEMLPVVDKPVIQYVVEEILASGIKEILIITGKGKHVIEDHFDRSPELEQLLQSNGKLDLLAELRSVSNGASIHYIRQKEQRGLGDAIRCARAWVNDEPFVVLLGDTIMRSSTPATRQLAELFDRYGTSIIAVEHVPREKLSRYGIVKGKTVEECVFLIEDLVEKPKPEEAPSDLGITGRYILTPAIFDCIDQTTPGVGGEIQITDAIRLLLTHERAYAAILEGTRYDIGNKMDYLKATVELALARPDLGPQLRQFLQAQLKA